MLGIIRAAGPGPVVAPLQAVAAIKAASRSASERWMRTVFPLYALCLDPEML